MEIKIQALRFDATEKLQEFATKKVERLAKSYEDIQKVEVQLKIIKPQTAMNKTTSITVVAPGGTQFVEKTCNTFEEAIDLCVDALKVKMTKTKEKSRNH
jgi:putative sigma-54 modulation protein